MGFLREKHLTVFSSETVNIKKLANLTANTKNYRQITLNTKTHSDPLNTSRSPDTRQRICLSLSKLGSDLQEFNSRKFHLYLTFLKSEWRISRDDV